VTLGRIVNGKKQPAQGSPTKTNSSDSTKQTQ